MHDLLTDTLPTEWEGRAIDPDFRPMIWLLIRTRRAKTDEDSARMICEAVHCRAGARSAVPGSL